MEAILETGIITWDDFRHFLHDKVVRMALGDYVCSDFNHLAGDTNNVLVLSTHDNPRGLDVCIIQGTATETYMETCNFLVRLLAASEKRDVSIRGYNHALLPVADPTLSYLFEHSRETLIKVTLETLP
jgi:hypothetical protein